MTFLELLKMLFIRDAGVMDFRKVPLVEHPRETPVLKDTGEIPNIWPIAPNQVTAAQIAAGSIATDKLAISCNGYLAQPGSVCPETKLIIRG